MFHTPPVDSRRTWLVEKSEQESYGVVDDEHDDHDEHNEHNEHNEHTEHIEQNDGTLSKDEGVNTVAKANPEHTVIAESKDINEPLLESTAASAASSASVAPSPVPATHSPTASEFTVAPITVLPSTLSNAVDQFLNSLQEPRYASPLSPDDIGTLYQEFYIQFRHTASEYVKRQVLPPRRKEVQMETYQEIAEKKRERSLRPVKINSYLELAEARVCSEVYDK